MAMADEAEEDQALDLSGRALTSGDLQTDILVFQHATELNMSRNALTEFPLISRRLRSLTLSHNKYAII